MEPTVLDGLCGDLVVGVLVVLALYADDDVVALCEAAVTAGLEAVATSSAGVGGVEGRALAVIAGGTSERLHLLSGHGGLSGGEEGLGGEAGAHGWGIYANWGRGMTCAELGL